MEHFYEGIETGFELEASAPYSLNYLIFVQNIHLNNENIYKESPLFPYVDSSTWGILKEEFKKTFIEVWGEVVNKNSQNGFYDHSGVFDIDKALFQKLFENDEKGIFGYVESVKTFLAWWNGIYGRIAIEKVFDDYTTNEVYKELSASLNVNKRLRINLIYDKPLLAGYSERSWYVVLPIEDIFIPYKIPEIVPKLLKCCEVI
ncbi:group-specific protein [Peribacillus butanolivorans]|uniref:group-specific protein n=1 Tax=Peribacillus butanolivorans TaxID=421767 RepID=UPI00367CC153